MSDNLGQDDVTPQRGTDGSAEGTPQWTAPEAWAPPAAQDAWQQPVWQQPGWQQPAWQQPAWQQQPSWQTGAPGQPSGPWQRPGGWTPPPKPGLFPLRPLPFGTLLGTPFRVLRHNPRATVGGSLLVQLIATLASVVLIGATAAFAVTRIAAAEGTTAETTQAIAAGSIAILIAAFLVTVAISLIGTALVQGLVASEVSHGALGEKLTLRGLWRATRGRRWRLIGWTVLLAAAGTASIVLVVVAAVLSSLAGSVPATVLFSVLAGLGLIVLWVWIGTKTALTPSVIIVERTGIMAGIARSWRLTNRSFWRTFGTIALVVVICSAASAVISVPLQVIFTIVLAVIDPTGSLQSQASITVTIVYYGISLIVSTLVGSITSVIESAATTTIYLDLRMRHEGLDADLRRTVDDRAAGRQDASDPFATPRHEPAAWQAAPPAWRGVPPYRGAP
ncbi:hypothetical protein [Humibacter sp. RRB41]|uniref:hypothetical protein n=1 Tax=Humibacter sp. RRB41 TaxID=2919946 RepID=UPI001FAA8C2A|nr:hypothetical protein [Humibacter sp. RRB41]